MRIPNGTLVRLKGHITQMFDPEELDIQGMLWIVEGYDQRLMHPYRCKSLASGEWDMFAEDELEVADG